MAPDRNELLEKLDRISQIYDQKLRVEEIMRNFQPEDNYERKIALPQFPGEYDSEAERKGLFNRVQHHKDNAVDLMELAYSQVYEPKKPAEPEIKTYVDPGPTSDEKEKSMKLGCTSVAALVIGVLFTIGFFMNLSNHFPAFALVVAIAGIATFLVSCAKTAAIKREQRERADAVIAIYKEENVQAKADYQAAMVAYEKAMAAYQPKFRAFMEEYVPWRAIYLQTVEEEMEIADRLEEDRKAGIQKIYEEVYLPAEELLSDYNDLLAEDYLPVIDEISNLIRSGRADDVKEAINLYEDIQFRERQLEQEREMEAQRLLAEERHHQEQMKFQKEQENQRRREEEQKQKDAERHHQEEMAQRERMERDRKLQADADRRQAQRAEMDRRSKEDAATRRQCNTCALNAHCSVAFTRPNCASFKPKK